MSSVRCTYTANKRSLRADNCHPVALCRLDGAAQFVLKSCLEIMLNQVFENLSWHPRVYSGAAPKDRSLFHIVAQSAFYSFSL